MPLWVYTYIVIKKKAKTKENKKMSYLNKEAYEGKKEYASRKMESNKEIGLNTGLTEEQCDLLEQLCSKRHELHINGKSLFNSESAFRCDELVCTDCENYIPRKIKDIGLPELSLSYDFLDFPINDDWYDLDDDEKEAYSEDYDEAYHKWYEEKQWELAEILSEINSEIENYLFTIDKNYGTNYCPSGVTRIY